MKNFIKKFTALPIYFSDEGVTYKTVLETNGGNCLNIYVFISSVENWHKSFEIFEEFQLIELKHNGWLQGYLFASSNFKDEKGGLLAIDELLEFAKKNNYKTLIDEYENNINNRTSAPF